MALSFKKTFPATWWLLASRRAHIFYLCLLGALALVLLGIHVDALIFRYRAERLIGEMQALELRKSSFADADRLLDRYRKQARVKGGCQPSECRFSISLAHLAFEPPMMTNPEIVDYGPTGQLTRVLQAIGLRPARVEADVRVANGVVRGKWLRVYASTRDGMMEFAGAGTVPRFDARSVDNYWFDSYPDFAVYAWRGKWTVGVSFTPYARPAEIRQAMSFSLACLSRWFDGCSYPEELMPGAVQIRREADQMFALHPELKDAHGCTADTLVRYGRDLSNIAVLQVERTYPVTQDPRGVYHWHADYKLLEVLHGRVLGSLSRAPVSAYSDSVLLLPDRQRLSPQTFAPGKAVVAFLDYELREPSRCGVVPASEENLRLVRRGIAQGQE